MEAARDFIPFEDYGQGTDPAPASGVDVALAVLRDVSATAVEDAACWGLKAASDFAGRVEELSRTVEYLQVVAASAVDRVQEAVRGGRREGRNVVGHGLARGRRRSCNGRWAIVWHAGRSARFRGGFRDPDQCSRGRSGERRGR